MGCECTKLKKPPNPAEVGESKSNTPKHDSTVNISKMDFPNDIPMELKPFAYNADEISIGIKKTDLRSDSSTRSIQQSESQSTKQESRNGDDKDCRTSNPLVSALSSSKFFIRTKKRPKKSGKSTEKSGNPKSDINDPANIGRNEHCTRTLSNPVLEVPTIVIDECPSPSVSAPPNGIVNSCRDSEMWDLLTSIRNMPNDIQQHCQQSSCNGVRHQNRFTNFVRRRSSEEKLISQTKTSAENMMNDDWVLKIIRCFPFPSPKQSPKNSPPSSPHASCDKQTVVACSSSLVPAATTTTDSSMKKSKCRAMKLKSDPSNGSAYCTLGMMVRKTIETTFPPLIPWDVWLRKRLANWTQCSGHEGTVVPATEKTVWKKCAHDSTEAKTYVQLMNDAVSAITPKFYKQVEHKGEFFMELEDLTRSFVDPCMMDIKMGTRTFLESEVQKQCKRPDLYDKMIAIDPNEPSPSEHEEKAITKLRYMTFREQRSSSAALGFRIDAAKMSGAALQKDFQSVRTRDQVKAVVRIFLQTMDAVVCKSLLERLRFIREKVEQSQFFRSHQVIGSSILIVHDVNNANAWIIDFAKAVPVEPGIINHRSLWTLGNHEDGYLFGLDNLIEVMEELHLEFKGERF